MPSASGTKFDQLITRIHLPSLRHRLKNIASSFDQRCLRIAFFVALARSRYSAAWAANPSRAARTDIARYSRIAQTDASTARIALLSLGSLLSAELLSAPDCIALSQNHRPQRSSNCVFRR